MDKVWICDCFSDTVEMEVVFELVHKTSCLLDRQPSSSALEVVSINNPYSEADIHDRLLECGVKRLYWCQGNSDDQWNYTLYVDTLKKLIQKYNPRMILFHATAFNKIVAAQLQTAFECGLTADCSDFQLENGALIQIRPVYEGKKDAYIHTYSNLQMATIRLRQNNQKIPISNGKKTNELAVEFIEISPDNASAYTFHPLSIIGPTESNSPLELVLTGGMGLKKIENFHKLRRLANRLKAGIGATRPLFEMGWADKSELVGMSGAFISPELLVMFGVSGSPQHLEGVRAQKIISINPDVNAPIHQICDYVILQDAQMVLDSLLELTETQNGGDSSSR